MRLIKHTQNALVATAIFGMLLPTALLSADELPQPKANDEQRAVDVELGPNNVLRGTLVDTAGKPAPAVNVFLVQDGSVVAAGLSNAKGAFAVANLAGGNYQIAAGDRAIDVRCWAGKTAPPNAVAATLIQVNDVQRGQVHPGTCMLANPWVVAGVVAAAIFIPVGIKSIRDNRDDNGDGTAGSTPVNAS